MVVKEEEDAYETEPKRRKLASPSKKPPICGVPISMVIPKPEGSTDIVSFKEPPSRTYRCGYHGLISLCEGQYDIQEKERNAMRIYFGVMRQRSYCGSRRNISSI